MKTILVEDNPSVRNILSGMFQDYCPEIDLIGVATNVQDGQQLIEQLKPDLVFLDVEMPDGTGFDLLRNIQHISFQVIFITAHEKYSLQAIKFSALDYLLKPIDLDDLMSAVQKALSNQKAEPPDRKSVV